MTNNEAYWTERALKRAEEAYLHDAALTAKLFHEYESAAKAIKREISAFYSKYAGKYGLTYDQAVRLLNRKEFQEWKASLAEYVDYIATIQDPKVKALLTAQLDALSANSSISRLEALQGQIDLILNDLFDKGVAQMPTVWNFLKRRSTNTIPSWNEPSNWKNRRPLLKKKSRSRITV